MSTVIERTTTPVIERESDSAGWAVAIIVLILAILVAAVVWANYHRAAPAPASGGTNINVTLPSTSGGGTSGGTGGGTSGGAPSGGTTGGTSGTGY